MQLSLPAPEICAGRNDCAQAGSAQCGATNDLCQCWVRQDNATPFCSQVTERGKSGLCCSGIYEGKKQKQGKKDTSRCVAHDSGACQAGEDVCLGEPGGVRAGRRVRSDHGQCPILCDAGGWRVHRVQHGCGVPGPFRDRCGLHHLSGAVRRNHHRLLPARRLIGHQRGGWMALVWCLVWLLAPELGIGPITL
jgi:hypothetical protein